MTTRKIIREQTGARAATAATRVLRSPKSTRDQRTAAGSRLTQLPDRLR